MPHSVSSASEEGSAALAATPMEEEQGAAVDTNQSADEDLDMADVGEVEPEAEAAGTSTGAAPAEGGTGAPEIEVQKKPEIKLEDLFDGVDSDDDEFPTSSNPAAGESQEPPSSQGYLIYAPRWN